MLNLDATVLVSNIYSSQRDFYTKTVLYSIGSIVLIEVLRNQVPEINLLQLIPGFYLALLFFSLLILLVGGDLLLRLPFEFDIRKEFGTKTEQRISLIANLRFRLLLFTAIVLTSLRSILPLSLDSFNSYGEDTLENLWSFNEVLNLEGILLILLSFLSQFPISLIFYLTDEIKSNKLPEIWKPLSLLAFLAAGIATPTIDGSTQLTFAFSTIFLYLIIINLLIKRLSIKFIGITSIT